MQETCVIGGCEISQELGRAGFAGGVVVGVVLGWWWWRRKEEEEKD